MKGDDVDNEQRERVIEILRRMAEALEGLATAVAAANAPMYELNVDDFPALEEGICGRCLNWPCTCEADEASTSGKDQP